MKLRPGVLLSAVFVFILTTMTSCVREYICECEITYTGQPALPPKEIKQYEIKDTKGKAESMCTGNSGEYTHGNITTKEDCILF